MCSQIRLIAQDTISDEQIWTFRAIYVPMESERNKGKIPVLETHIFNEKDSLTIILQQ